MVFRKKKKEEPVIMKDNNIIETGEEKKRIVIPEDVIESINTFNKSYAPIFSPEQFPIPQQEHTKITLLFAIYDELKKIREIAEKE